MPRPRTLLGAAAGVDCRGRPGFLGAWIGRSRLVAARALGWRIRYPHPVSPLVPSPYCWQPHCPLPPELDHRPRCLGCAGDSSACRAARARCCERCTCLSLGPSSRCDETEPVELGLLELESAVDAALESELDAAVLAGLADLARLDDSALEDDDLDPDPEALDPDELARLIAEILDRYPPSAPEQ